jgi:hypothetical protein
MTPEVVGPNPIRLWLHSTKKTLSLSLSLFSLFPTSTLLCESIVRWSTMHKQGRELKLRQGPEGELACTLILVFPGLRWWFLLFKLPNLCYFVTSDFGTWWWQRLEAFWDACYQKPRFPLKKLWIEIWTLVAILVTAQREMRRKAREKALSI